MRHELPELPYPIDALEPHLSGELLEYHWGKHHAKYVETLNALIVGTEFEELPLEQICTAAGAGAVRNNAAQAWNHDFYWKCLTPGGGGAPAGRLAEAIDARFGGFEAFRQAFMEAGKALFGSGWIWLSLDEAGELAIESAANADNPLMRGHTPLMTCDVWEHAYYLDYRNDRAGYLHAFFELVDWDFVASRLPA